MSNDAVPSGIEPATVRHLDRRLAGIQRDCRLPSAVAGIVRGGDLVWARAVGTLDGRAGGAAPDLDTQYRMGSITKTFVAVAVMRLRDAGGLDLSDRLEEHVPGSRLGRATIAQLLSHAAGVQAETNGPWWERTPGGSWDELVASAVGQRFRAGRRFHYTNVGYGALGELLARAHGVSWFDVVRRDLLEPLGMRRTTPRPSGKAAPGWAVHPFADVLLPEPEHDAGAMAPAGQLWTTADDLAKWAAFAAGDVGDVLRATRWRRCSSRTRSGTTRGSRGRSPTGSASRSGTSMGDGSWATAGPCPVSSPACGSTWSRVTGSCRSPTRPRGRSGRRSVSC